MAKILVAASGRTVHQPDGTLWPAEGMEDPGTHFTRRRLSDGDLIPKPREAKKSEGDK